MTGKFFQSKFKLLVLFLVFVLSLLRLSKEEAIYPTGDAAEYTLMTEALYNHFSPDIRYSDYESFKKLFIKSNKWETNPRWLFYDEVGSYLDKKNLELCNSHGDFFVDYYGKKYSCHFFVYSLINLPTRWICGIIKFNPLLIHQYTNVLLILLTSILFFKHSPFEELETSVFVLLFFYSTNYWYLTWQHPEVFTTCFTSLGLWLFFGKKYYWGILLVTIASLQNQPLAILLLVLCLITLFKRGIKFKNILLIGLSSALVLWPSVFYYYHFGATNLAKLVGSVQYKYVTTNRVAGFFFDINQGVILALPFVLLLYIGLLFRKIITTKKQSFDFYILIPVGLVGAVFFASMIDNWNHGQAVVNRYVTYIGGAILVHCFFLLKEIKNEKTRMALIYIALSTQIVTVYYHQSLIKHDWSGNDPKPISNWVLENYPELYNPDPAIFLNRYSLFVFHDSANSPAYYMKGNGEITKLLVHKKYLNNLKNFGFTQNQILDAGNKSSFTNGWTYIDVDKNFKSGFSNATLKKIDNQRKIAETINKMKTNQEWSVGIKKKYIESSLSEEEIFKREASYMLGISLAETREEKIKEKIQQIKQDTQWYNFIKEKAKEKNLPLDSAILFDAIYVVDQKIKEENENN